MYMARLFVFMCLLIQLMQGSCGSSEVHDLVGVTWRGEVVRLVNGADPNAEIARVPTGFKNLNAFAASKNRRSGFTVSSGHRESWLLDIDSQTLGVVGKIQLDSLLDVRGLAVVPSGDLLAIAEGVDKNAPMGLYKIDTKSGRCTLLGTTNNSGIQGLTCREDGALIGYASGYYTRGSRGMLVIDSRNAQTTDVSDADPPGILQTLAYTPQGTLVGFGLGNKMVTIGLDEYMVSMHTFPDDIRGFDYLARNQ